MKKLILAGFILIFAQPSYARLEVCNTTDLVLMVAVGYNTTEERIASEGWWRIYPGFCEVPVDVTFLQGAYYVHAESNPRSTMPVDSFFWGDEKPLCVETNPEFRLTNASLCNEGNIVVNFDIVEKNWQNSNSVEIVYPERRYTSQFRARVAGMQRLLSMLGHDVGDIDGVLGEQTAEVLSRIGTANQIFGLDFKQIYPVLEQLLAANQGIDN